MMLYHNHTLFRVMTYLGLILIMVLFSYHGIAKESAQYNQEQIKTLGFDIAKSLRCPASINKSLFESQTAIANELKAEIFLQLEQGQSKQQIINFMVERYGEKIHYMPSFSAATSVLFLLPLALLIFAVSFVCWLRKRQLTTQAYSTGDSYE
ncbi:cytochrome c-type biogenesis protein CcmH [Shewanella maritima]|uniref:cytochrome c-type biogenesis protein n=1 Tax=Shewanella maritima TaxID=2520507 RepID=UPI0037367C9A